MYGIGNNYSSYYHYYSSMYGRHNSYGFHNNGWNPGYSTVPNYALDNNIRLGKIMSNRYSQIKEQVKEQEAYEQESKEFTSEFDSVFGQLKEASSSLKSFSDGSVFHPTGYGSSNSDVAAVTQNTAAVTEPIYLEVTQTAASTSYASKALSSAGNTLQGQHTLTITAPDGAVSLVHVELDAAQDNEANLNRIASALNEKNLGITASVSETEGKSTLTFTSDKTGTEHAFTAVLTGNSAQAVGLEERQQAQDAKYKVNGGDEQISQSNSIRLLEGDLGVQIKGTGNTEISRKTVDDTRTVEAVKKFANSYNKALDFLDKYKDKSAALNKLAYSYGTTKFGSQSLSRIGINADSRGGLSVNEGILKDALRNNREDVEKVLGGAGGLASQTYAKASSNLQISSHLYPKPESMTSSGYLYGRNRNYITPYITGMFFHTMI